MNSPEICINQKKINVVSFEEDTNISAKTSDLNVQIKPVKSYDVEGNSPDGPSYNPTQSGLIKVISFEGQEESLNHSKPELEQKKSISVVSFDDKNQSTARKRDIEVIKSLNSNSQVPDNAGDYLVGPDGHLYLESQGLLIELSNFHIIAEKIFINDNGLHQEVFYYFKCILEGRTEEKQIFISGYSLNSSNWLLEKLGVKYYISAYPGAYNFLKIYISKQFRFTEEETKYTQVGWRFINNKFVYLHGNGAIGCEFKNLKGSYDKRLEIDSSLKPYKAFESSLTLLNMSNNLEKTLPLFLYSHLAIMKELFSLAGAEPKFLLWIYGLTGSRKTSVSKVFFNLFNRSSSPIISATFKDTPTAIELKAFEYKDSILLLDDYHPTTSVTERKSMEALASHALRMYGDKITKSRATQNLDRQKEFPPRGLCVITGEDRLGGESTVARYIGIEVAAGDYKTDILTYHQLNPLILSTHMYYFIDWISVNFDEIISVIKNDFHKLRDNSHKLFRHGRLNEAYIIMLITAKLLLHYSVTIGYYNHDSANAMLSEWTSIIKQAIMSHELSNTNQDPAIMYLIAIEELLSSFKCNLIDTADTNSNKSNLIGYKDNEHYYLFPDIAYAHVRSFWKGQGIEFPVSKEQIHKALDNLGVIKTLKEGDRVRRTIKNTFRNQKNIRYLVINTEKMITLIGNI